MSGFDLDSARVAYSEKDTDELIRIAYFEDDYLVEAIEIAREELKHRGIIDINDKRVTKIEAVIREEQAVRERLAKEPLQLGWKIYCFLIADLIAIIVIIVKSSSGKERASKEALQYFLYGWLFRIVSVGAILLV